MLDEENEDGAYSKQGALGQSPVLHAKKKKRKTHICLERVFFFFISFNSCVTGIFCTNENLLSSCIPIDVPPIPHRPPVLPEEEAISQLAISSGRRRASSEDKADAVKAVLTNRK